jgi:hypothetical protein
MYASADAIPPYPYLWQDGVLNGRDAQTKLEELFAGPAAPTFVVEYGQPGGCNHSGKVAALLQQRYTYRATVDGLNVLVLGGNTAPAPVSSR